MTDNCPPLLRVLVVILTSLALQGTSSAMTSGVAGKPLSRAGGSSVTVQWAVKESREPGSMIGDLRQSLSQFVDASTLAETSFQTLPRPNQVTHSFVYFRDVLYISVGILAYSSRFFRNSFRLHQCMRCRLLLLMIAVSVCLSVCLSRMR